MLANDRGVDGDTLSDEMHYMEVEWQAASMAGGNDGRAVLWIDGVEASRREGLDNDSLRVERVRLGVVSGINVGSRGSLYFDAFESWRASFIGP